jgi:uncharacterized protein (DUF885 family)
MAKPVVLLPLLLIAAGCGGSPSERFARLSEEFVSTYLSFSPSSATSTGLHHYQKLNLDEMLDDMSPANLDKQRRFYQDFRERLSGFNPQKLSADERADLSILQDQIALNLLDLDEVHSHLHNPTLYVETLGNALFSPYVLEYAPLPERIHGIIARLQQVPLFLDQAGSNLSSSPEIWAKVAMDENQGNIDLTDKTIRQAAPENLREAYARAAQPALAAMRKFQDTLSNLAAHHDTDWRLRDIYSRKFQYTLETGEDAGTTLQNAEKELPRVRERMLKLALPLHHALAPSHGDHSELSGDERTNKVVGEVLAKIAERHTTREGFLDEARKDLDEARSFVQEKHLLTLPPRSNLQVIPTPDFMRGSYPVGGFNPAPPLEPDLGAFYWVTPIPADWDKTRVESKLREYNFYKLKLLTIHEAMPGHYVQAEIANGVEPKGRRLLRAVFGNGPYVEGWAQYATQTMLDQGFLNHSPEMELTFAKEELRVIANLILDVRLQMLDMKDQEALDLMEKQTFQEHEEAVEKLQRAKLTSCQLPMYFTGWRGWNQVRAAYQQAKGAGYTLSGFNDQALKAGAVPLTALGGLLK